MPPSAPAPASGASMGPLSAIAAPLMIFGAVSSGIGSYYSAKSNKVQLQLQSDIARINSRISELGAKSALMAGERESQSVKMRTGQMKAKQIVGMAASGIELSSGSAQDVLNSTDFMGEIDANTVEANAIRAAWGYRTQASNLQSEALMAQANASGISPGMSAMTSLLGSAAYAAPTYYMMKKSGA